MSCHQTYSIHNEIISKNIEDFDEEDFLGRRHCIVSGI